MIGRRPGDQQHDGKRNHAAIEGDERFINREAQVKRSDGRGGKPEDEQPFDGDERRKRQERRGDAAARRGGDARAVHWPVDCPGFVRAVYWVSLSNRAASILPSARPFLVPPRLSSA